jgi:Protein of unknown function (DUF3105)
MLGTEPTLRGSGRPSRPPAAVLVALALLLAAGPIGLALSHPNRVSARAPTRTLDELARDAGCRLTEYGTDPNSNPPVSGRVDERVYATDGSYVGRRPPTKLASVHALLHGRIVLQYRPELPAAQVRTLDRLVRRTPSRTLLFANTTGMRAPVAATAYLTLMTCPRVDAATLRALRAFRTRRVGFGQGF